jgi:hypothetical protein
MSNCEQELSGNELNSSSNSSLGCTGDVGGVLKGFDCKEEQEGEDVPFVEADCISTLMSSMEFAEPGRWSAGDVGGVCCVLVRESCCRMFKDGKSWAKELEEAKLSWCTFVSSEKELEMESKLKAASVVTLVSRRVY